MRARTVTRWSGWPEQPPTRLFTVLDILDDGARVPGPGWTVVEAGTDGTLTGRVLAGLGEDLLAVDPSGHDGTDLRQ